METTVHCINFRPFFTGESSACEADLARAVSEASAGEGEAKGEAGPRAASVTPFESIGSDLTSLVLFESKGIRGRCYSSYKEYLDQLYMYRQRKTDMI